MARDYKACDWAKEIGRQLQAGDTIGLNAWRRESEAHCRLGKKKDYFRVPHRCWDCEQQHQALENQNVGPAQIGNMLHGNLPNRSKPSSNIPDDH